MPAATQLDVRKAIDDAATRTATLQTAQLTLEEKRGQYLGAVARPVQAAQYDKQLFDLAALSAHQLARLGELEVAVP